MLKFAHIADVHLGYEQYRLPYRASEFAEAFREAIRKAVEERVDFILIAGDLFHQSRPSPETLKEAMDILGMARDSGIPVFAIEGNHDRTQRRISAYHLLESLGYLNLIGIRDERVDGSWVESERLGEKWMVKGIFEKGNRRVEIHGMKYMSSAWLERNKPKNLFKPEGDSILMLHQGVKEIMDKMSLIPETQKGYYELSLEDLPKGYAYYALGHIHRSYVTSYGGGTLVYPGSLQRWDFGDYERRYRYRGPKDGFKEEKGGDKGFYIVEDFRPRFIRLEVRPFIDIVIEADSETVRRALKELSSKIPEESFVRLTLKWKRPYDVSVFPDMLKVRHLHLRTRFGEDSGKGMVKSGLPSEYFLPVEKEIIDLSCGQDIEPDGVERVISLLMGDGWEERDGEVKETIKKQDIGENVKKGSKKAEKSVKHSKPHRGNPMDITSWLRRGRA